MAFEVSYNLENESQFWDGEKTCTTATPPEGATRLIGDTELDDIASTRCESHEIIDNSLRSFLEITTSYKSMAARLGSEPKLTVARRIPTD